ncbi:Aste57867_23236 [Aphanomyces stellatus]|uniref:Aste57867_23236 protein n=1 Tax=Aphanomyces stellatus TaxID=120398 RepID=A0A485LRT9_9STRA|nr:hypothetical protein As57867_023165 [Aphanomyces stellatus]VFT99881.1 Aste57867_23236 [Aphanomyces stellatus]
MAVEYLLQAGTNTGIATKNFKTVRIRATELKLNGIIEALDDYTKTTCGLCILAENGDLDGVRHSLANYMNVDVKGEGGETALHWASCTGNVELAKLLLARGANGGTTPLMEACNSGHAELAKVLLDAGAKLD